MSLVVLVALFELKHFLADFLWQTEYHLGKFKDVGWVAPLASHCFVHAYCTAIICAIVNPHLLWLALVDFGTHFAMDRIKASRKLLGRFKSLDSNSYRYAHHLANHSGPYKLEGEEMLLSNKYFWWSLGLDQMVHQLTGLFIVAKLVGVC